MPELPEVETVVKTLEQLISQRKITDVHVLYDKILDRNTEEFKQTIINQSFLGFKRRGKYIIFQLNNCDLVVHLRMEGKFYVKSVDENFDHHTHIQFFLDDGRRLDYHDVRKFGTFEIIDKSDNYDCFKKLGPEPFSEMFNEEYIKNKIRNKKIALKKMLLDQSFVAGIGNIYADEVCFRMKLHPLHLINDLSDKQVKELIISIRSVLSKAIKAGGSTIRSYTSSLGVNGLFQLQIDVYGRENEPCTNCKTRIKKIKVGGRGTCFCPNCQKI